MGQATVEEVGQQELVSRMGSGLLHEGSSGPAVEALQQALNAEGYSSAVDGVYGAQTRQAVEELQGANGLIVDGVVGPQTRASLI